MGGARKVVIHLSKKVVRRRCFMIIVLSFIEQPGDRRFLRRLMKVNHLELDKPDKPHLWRDFHGMKTFLIVSYYNFFNCFY